MSFFRPEALNLLRRYSGSVVFAAIAVFLIWTGIGWIRSGDQVGYLIILLGAFPLLAIFGAVERALLAGRSARRGPGLVTVEEGRISYFGPEGGTIIALDALSRVEIVTTDAGPSAADLFWLFADATGRTVEIPGSAENATAIIDGLESLPGLNHMAVLSANASTVPARFLIWRRGGSAPAITSVP